VPRRDSATEVTYFTMYSVGAPKGFSHRSDFTMYSVGFLPK
jgi:hypothetical protein